MTHMKLLSWNIQGLHDKVKHSLVFTYLKKHNPHICILQENHLVGSKVLGLKKPWVGHYHATHSHYMRTRTLALVSQITKL